MTKKDFTDTLFKAMYELGYRKAELVKGRIFFYKEDTMMGVWVPRIPVECTCFTDEQKYINIGEYIGIVDWSKVKVDTPILVSFDGCNWFKEYFAKVQNDTVYAFDGGATSWSVSNKKYCVTSWRYAKLAEV
jgi:hypothetical protein